MKVKLTSLQSNHKNLRTDSFEGVIEKLPEEGDENFTLVGRGLDFGVRVLRTTEIESVLNISDTSMEFKTRNSHYKLEVILK